VYVYTYVCMYVYTYDDDGRTPTTQHHEQQHHHQPRPVQVRYLEYSLDAAGDVFEVLDRYTLESLVGKGAYGKVCSGLDRHTEQGCAIKKIAGVFRNKQDARRTLIELRILRALSDHENIVAIRDVFPPPSLPNFDDLYIVYDLMETDLHQLLKSPQAITAEQVRYIIYQILRAIKYIHSAGVLHRDLKPSNVLMSSRCDVQICDFGLSAFEKSQEQLAEYVVTRWYRAPEILLSCSKYDNKIDVWSVGCIFAEILGRRPLFPGGDSEHVHESDIQGCWLALVRNGDVHVCVQRRRPAVSEFCQKHTGASISGNSSPVPTPTLLISCVCCWRLIPRNARQLRTRFVTPTLLGCTFRRTSRCFEVRAFRARRT
jgi:serine/threonine protein kinase